MLHLAINENFLRTKIKQITVYVHCICPGLLSSNYIRRLCTKVRNFTIVFTYLVLYCVIRYKVIAFLLSSSVPGNAANCLLILEKAQLENYAMGKTKVCYA